MTKKSDKAAAQEEAQRALTHAGGMAHLRRHVIETQSTLSAQTLDPSLFPSVTLPSLEGMLVSVPEPHPIGEEEVEEAFDRLAFEAAPRTQRARGQEIQMGDELHLDLIGYMGGYLLPMSAHEGLRVILEPDVFMSGFGSALVGAKVGEAAIVQLPVPDDFAIAEVRGEEIVFAVEVCEAFEVGSFDPEDPELFRTIGLGDDLATTLDAILLLLLDERTRTLSESVIAAMLDAISAKVDVEIPEALIKAELNTLWSQSEGRFLLEKGIEQEDIETSWEGWWADAELRADASQRLKGGLIMYAIANQKDLVGDQAALDGFIGDAAAALGVTLTAEESLSQPFKNREQLVDQYVYAQALAYLSQHVTIKIGDSVAAPGDDVSVAPQISS